MLENPDWKYDEIPEIYNGKNIIDFVDPDIEQKLNELEEEEELQLKELENQIEGDDVPEEYKEAMKDIKKRTEEIRIQSALNKKTRAKSKYKNLENLKEKLESKGLDSSRVEERFGGDKGKAKPRMMKKLLGIKDGGMSEEDLSLAKRRAMQNELDSDEDSIELKKRHKSKMREIARNRSVSTKRELTPMEIVKSVLSSLPTRSRGEAIRDSNWRASSVRVITRSTT